jgi:hypothetical protein
VRDILSLSAREQVIPRNLIKTTEARVKNVGSKSGEFKVLKF